MIKRLLFLSAFFLSLIAVAQDTVHVTWRFSDFRLSPMSVKRVTIQPLYAPGIHGTNIIVSDAMSFQTGTNGSLTISNIANGRSYRVTFFGLPTQFGTNILTVFTNTFPTNVTGLVSGADPQFISAPIQDAATVAYSRAATDSLFLRRTNGIGANVTLYGTNTFSAISLGGVARTNWPTGGGGSGVSNAVPPLHATNGVVELTNAALLSLAQSNTFPSGLRLGVLGTNGTLFFWNGVDEDYNRTLTVSDEGFEFDNILNAPFGNFYTWVSSPLFLGQFSGNASNLTNGAPALATNNAVAPDGYVLARTGNRLRLEERATLAQATNIAEWLIVTSSIPNAVYVSASRGTLNGERNNPLKPFVTIAAATDAALPGDTVMILDGTFIEAISTKTGVDYWFNRGTRLVAPADNANFNLNHSGLCRVSGYATITNANFQYPVIDLTGSSRQLDFAAERIDCPHGFLLSGAGTTLTNVFVNVRNAVVAVNIVAPDTVPNRILAIYDSTLTVSAEFAVAGVELYNCAVTGYESSNPVTNRLVRCRLNSVGLLGPGSLTIFEDCTVRGSNPYVAGRVSGTYRLE